jgi:DNA-directed RNA polymerase specialized sigma24 family protein
LARYSKSSSTELVRACLGSKDEEAWAEFIRRFQVVIAAAVLRTARHWGEPLRPQLDDLIQDTYLKLFENNSRLLRSFKPRHEDSIYGFLKVVAANVVHDHFKSALAAKRGVPGDVATCGTGSADAFAVALPSCAPLP